MESFKILILAGGHSSRMGSPKHLLPLSNRPLYVQLVQILHETLPKTETIHFSIAARSDLDGTLRNGIITLPPQDGSTRSSLRLELVVDDTEEDIGPAAGLLAAHHRDPTAIWLAVACDYPLLEETAVRQLIENYEAPATCFKNADGFSEPLLGIWSPQALRSLKQNVASGRSGPAYTLRQLNSKLITPIREEWLMNVNTKEEWEAAKTRMQEDHSKDGL